MRTLTTVILITFLLSACAVRVSDPDELNDPNSHPKGNVRPLDSYMEHAGDVKLVILHGMSDTCPGYALGKHGWMTDNAYVADAGFRKLEEPEEAIRIRSKEFVEVNGPFDNPDSYITLLRQKFDYTTATNRHIKVEVNEITWSHLTQWLKSNQLAYDATGNIKDANDSSASCVDEPARKYAPPPSRDYINKMMKEGVLDRDLTDAVLYVGKYYHPIHDGVDAALCHALTEEHIPTTIDGKGNITTAGKCIWPPLAQGHDDTQYMFITHSQGGHIMLNVLVDLWKRQHHLDRMENPRAPTFSTNLIQKTSVLYMMANQLSLLDMALDPEVAAINHNVGQPNPDVTHHDILQMLMNDKSKESTGNDRASSSNCKQNNPLSAFANIHAGRCGAPPPPAGIQIQSLDGHSPGTPADDKHLDVVAFSDTDDLLSWGVPAWYKTDYTLNITNVYVRNDKWIPGLWLFRWPPTLHTHYFINSQVWDVIRCGATDGHVNDCAAKPH